MEQAEFWSLIAASREGSPPNLQAQTLRLERLLGRLSPNTMVLFHRQLVAANHDLFSWSAWGAYRLLVGVDSDDGFTDFRTWLVSLGEDTYRRVAADPDALADVPWDGPDTLADAEQFAEVAAVAYDAKTGRDLFEDNPWIPIPEMPADQCPSGERFDPTPEELRTRYPRLSAPQAV